MKVSTDQIRQALGLLARLPDVRSQLSNFRCRGMLANGRPCEKKLLETRNQIRYGRIVIWQKCERCGNVNEIMLEAVM